MSILDWSVVVFVVVVFALIVSVVTCWALLELKDKND